MELRRLMITRDYSLNYQNSQELVERAHIIDSHRKEWRDSASTCFDQRSGLRGKGASKERLFVESSRLKSGKPPSPAVRRRVVPDTIQSILVSIATEKPPSFLGGQFRRFFCLFC